MVVEKCVVIAVMGMDTHHVAGAQEMDTEVAMYARGMVEFILWENIWHAPHAMVDYESNAVCAMDQEGIAAVVTMVWLIAALAWAPEKVMKCKPKQKVVTKTAVIVMEVAELEQYVQNVMAREKS